MDELFVDTSWFKAAIDPKDQFHARAVQFRDSAKFQQFKIVTTNFILDESFTLIRKRCGLERTKKLFEWLQNFGIDLKLVRILVRDEKEVWKWFWKPWSDLSYTDCTSFAVMKRLGISQVATFDQHFAQAGFAVVS